MSVIIKCNYKNENYNTLYRTDGNFKFSNSDVDFLIPHVSKLNFRADRIMFTKILNIKKQTIKAYKDNILVKSIELIPQCASAQKCSDFLKKLFEESDININFTKDKLAYQGLLTIENTSESNYEVEADKTFLFCLGLLDLDDIKGILL